jgi:putative hydrolase of the HAD superfamily
MPPAALFFDLGNVLLGFSHERMCRQMAEVAGVSPDLVRHVLFAEEGPDCPQWRVEDGRLNCREYYELFCDRIGTRPERRALEHAACDIFWPLEESRELVQRLATAGHRLGILSNINPLHWQFVSDGRFPWLRPPGAAGSLFDFAVTSYEVGAMKPDARIYAAAVALAGAPAGSVFFVDDRAENVAGARAAGLDAVPFVGIAQLISDLSRRSVHGAAASFSASTTIVQPR